MGKTFRRKIIKQESAKLSTLLYHLFVIIILYGTLLPVLGVVFYGFGGKGNESTSYYFFHSLEYLGKSLLLAIPVTIVASLFALILSFTLWRFEFRGRRFAQIMALAPLLNPPFVGSISFIMLFGKRGLITHDLLGLNVTPFGYWGVFIMQVIGLTTLGYLFISSGVKRINTVYEEAGRTVGASEFKIFKTITLPLLKPDIIGGMLLIFLGSMADFGTPLIIGGPFQTLSSDLYIQITGIYDMRGASISGAILLFPCLLVFLWQRYSLSKKKYWGKDTGVDSVLYQKPSQPIKIILILFCFLFQMLLILKYGFIVIGAFTKNWGHDYTLTLNHFISISHREWKPFVNSVNLAIGVGIASSLLGVFLAYLNKHKIGKTALLLETVGTLPAAVPGILFGIGYLVTFKYPILGIGRFLWLSGPKLVLLGTGSIIYIICIFRYLNIGLRAGTSLLERQDPNIEYAAYTLGASEFKTFRTISLPLLKPAFKLAFMKNFASTMTTLGAIIFLLLPKNKVAVQQIFQIISSSEIGIAAAMSLSLSLLMGIMLFLFYLVINYRLILKNLRRIFL